MPEFSVIIPNYNHAGFLEQRIDSVLKQDYGDFEVIIIDDSSTDSSRKIIEQYRNHEKVKHIIYNETNSKSPFKQWAKGIENAAGEFIWIAESDDIASPEFLKTASQAFREFPGTGIFYCDGTIYDEERKINLKKFSEIKDHIYATDKWSLPYSNGGIKELNEYLKFDCTINNASSTVFRKKKAMNIYQEASGFHYFGDWYFYIQLCLVSDVYYCNLPLNTYRRHKDSHLSSSPLVFLERLEYFLILKTLYGNEKITDKRQLLNHFSYYYLHPGLFKHGLKNAFTIFLLYVKTDWRLAFRIFPRVLFAKSFRQLYKKYKVREIYYTEEI